MHVVRLHGSGDLRLHAEPIPVPAAGESLLRVKAVGVCGSDLHWFAEGGIGDAQLDKPLILGHEFAGITQNGERVAADPAIPCLACEFCLEGNPNLCNKLRFAGHEAEDGALREMISWPERCLYPLPDALSDADGALLEPLGVAMHAVDLAHLKPGMSVGIFGCGPIGLLTLQVARALGATQIIATDKLAHRMEAAQAMGATQVFLSHDGSENAEVWAASGESGVHVAFDCAGENAAVDTSIAAARAGGKVILVGIPADDWTGFTASIARRKGLTLKLCRRMKHTYPRAIRLVEQGLIDLRSLVTHRFPLAEAAKAFATAQRKEGIKVVIEP